MNQMKSIKTDYRIYEAKDVIDDFSGVVQVKNIRASVEHLTRHDLAVITEEVKEENGILYAKIYGRWSRAGEMPVVEWRPASLIQEELKLMTKEEIRDEIDHCEFRLMALKFMTLFITNLVLKKFRGYFKQGLPFHFSRWGIAITDPNDLKFAPVRTIILKTFSKKDILEIFKGEKQEWEQQKSKLEEEQLRRLFEEVSY